MIASDNDSFSLDWLVTKAFQPKRLEDFIYGIEVPPNRGNRKRILFITFLYMFSEPLP